MRINILKNHGFSSQFVEILSMMLEKDDGRRPAIHELFNKFERAKKSSNFEPILKNDHSGANYHMKEKPGSHQNV